MCQRDKTEIINPHTKKKKKYTPQSLIPLPCYTNCSFTGTVEKGGAGRGWGGAKKM